MEPPEIQISTAAAAGQGTVKGTVEYSRRRVKRITFVVYAAIVSLLRFNMGAKKLEKLTVGIPSAIWKSMVANAPSV